jgi:hypothetical protein
MSVFGDDRDVVIVHDAQFAVLRNSDAAITKIWRYI